MSTPPMLTMLATLLLQIAATAAPADLPPDLLDDPDVLSYCRALVQRSAAKDFDEHGAFVVRTPEGRHYFVEWPSNGSSNVLIWRGRVPEGVVAIVHTHPPLRYTPSKFDAAAARRFGVPVYILTPRRIIRTTGDKPEVVKIGRW